VKPPPPFDPQWVAEAQVNAQRPRRDAYACVVCGLEIPRWLQREVTPATAGKLPCSKCAASPDARRAVMLASPRWVAVLRTAHKLGGEAYLAARRDLLKVQEQRDMEEYRTYAPAAFKERP
jgi:hypothetical protein